MAGGCDGGGVGSPSSLETATNRMEKDVQSLMSLKPFARFLLQYVKDGGDINVDSDSSSDNNNVPLEIRLILEQLKPLTSTMSREDLMLLLEKAASGMYEDDLLMHLATDGEKEEEGEVVEERADLDLEEIMGTLKPGYVVKTKDARGRKVLVNVCGAKEVPKPARWRITEDTEEEERKDDRANADEYEINNLEKTHRFPLACSDKRVDIDRNGNACDVYDVAFNDEVVEVAAKAMFDTATREAKLRDTLATVCVEVVSKKCTTGGGEGNGNALDPKFTLPKRAFAGASLPPPMRVKKFLSSSLTRSQLRQQHARRRIVEINTTSNNNNATEGATPMSPLSTTRRQHHQMEQTSSEDEDEEEGGFAFRLSPERKKKRKQSQLKNVTTIANAAAADTAAATTSTTKKLRVKIETSYPDKPLTTFATVKLTFDSEQSLDRAKLNVCSRESTLRVSFDDDHQSKEGEDEEKEDLRRGKKSTQHQTEFPFFIDVEKIREIEVEELPRGEKEGEMGDTSGSDTSGRDPLTVMLKIPFILIK
ncbi:unnamed protein product [Bathycoccus prasinos]